ncbi:Cell division protein FtsW [Thioalkalivibrio nitratireducens DSM 14787]|uniref:Probable peptidoglycan glycosyltransferase FtsW n=1 Tax=Thioalkalivibrio nitratireducens (strain DSM 14787 / UNIQEM 213 / ALEN2) TaxID=1255043 RepID=L0E0R6_THIND|nr:putative lipid II flippase FtsW [Thioalkalivibrio nitratireducens]AGA34246.1 Cell division protein FtsW [Thioalkalivibrio nitratireducens DSM 14787]
MMPPISLAGLRITRLGTGIDLPMLLAAALLLGLGLVMVASASIDLADRHYGNPYHFFHRQLLFAGIGLAAALFFWSVPLRRWESAGPLLLLLIMVLLIVVLLPGVGRTVNGATRWIPLGVFNLQVSEPVKLLVVLYLSGYIVRHYSTLCLHFRGFVRPLIVLGLGTVLLLLQPDFGGAAIMLAIGMGMLFLAGARLWQFIMLGATIVAAMGVMAVATPYRMARLTAFLDPWQDPFATGFQLTQSLIAIGSGSWFGAGLGGSVQKLFYLPEAHNDFLFAVFAEEFGFVGVAVLVALFALLVWRCFVIGLLAERGGHAFGSHVAFGVGIWIGLQAAVNLGVNMGLLPTKGLTLPFLSYGGSSLIVTLAAVGLVLRVYREAQVPIPRTRRRCG